MACHFLSNIQSLQQIGTMAAANFQTRYKAVTILLTYQLTWILIIKVIISTIIEIIRKFNLIKRISHLKMKIMYLDKNKESIIIVSLIKLKQVSVKTIKAKIKMNP